MKRKNEIKRELVMQKAIRKFNKDSAREMVGYMHRVLFTYKGSDKILSTVEKIFNSFCGN